MAVALGVLKGCAAEGMVLCVLNLLPVPGTGTDGARIVQALRAAKRVEREGQGVTD